MKSRFLHYPWLTLCKVFRQRSWKASSGTRANLSTGGKETMSARAINQWISSLVPIGKLLPHDQTEAVINQSLNGICYFHYSHLSWGADKWIEKSELTKIDRTEDDVFARHQCVNEIPHSFHCVWTLWSKTKSKHKRPLMCDNMPQVMLILDSGKGSTVGEKTQTLASRSL